MQRCGRKAQALQSVLQEEDSLVERIQERHLKIGPQNQQRHAREARARAHIDHLAVWRKQPLGQRRGAVQIVAVDALVLVQHGRQVHLLIIFIQNHMERLKALNGQLVISDAQRIQAACQSLFVHRMLSSQNLIQLSPSLK